MRGDRVGASFCTISAYWNCDAASFSLIGSIANIPIGIFGVFWFAVAGLLALNDRSRRSLGMKGWLVLGLVTAAFCWNYLFFFLKAGCLTCYASYVLILGTLLTGWNLKGPFQLLSVRKVIGFVLVAAALLALYCGYNIYRMNSLIDTAEFRSWFRSLPVEGFTAKSPLMKGEENAKVTVVEFSDFGCPYCEKTASAILPYLASQKDVRVVFFPFPLDSTCNSKSQMVHPHSCDWSKVAYCANAQNAFWRVHDNIFKIARENEHLPPVKEHWESVGVPDLDQLKKCFENSETDKALRDLVNVGIEANIEGTPSFFFNGRRIPRFMPLPLWKAIVDELRSNP